METRAREAWRRALEPWALPVSLYEAASEPPQDRLSGRTIPGGGEDGAPSPTVEVVAAALGSGGSVLDVGASSGLHATALAGRGYRVTVVVEEDAAGRVIADDVDRARVSVTRVVGHWPDVAGNAGPCDVALSAHTVFDIPALGPFIEALHRSARRAVVLEATARHPWAGLSRYVQLLHGIELPRRPTVDELVEVIREVTGSEPLARWWSAPPAEQFDDLRDLLAHYRRLLLVPPERSIEAAGYLEPDVDETDDGHLVLGRRERELVTLSWKVR